AYCGADNLRLIREYPDRIRYVHLKQVDPAIQARVREERLGFAPAVRLGAMVEPPLGEPDMPSIIDALAALDRDLFCIVEQDMYPCDFDRPLPIAVRTQRYFATCGLGSGRPCPDPTATGHPPPVKPGAPHDMTIRVGIIGTGLIGEDHGRKLVNVINGSTVSGVTDVN